MKVKTLLLFLFFSASYAQNPAEAEKLVEEGIELHDKGDYPGAIAKYGKALEVDKNNLMALSEKALTLSASGQYDEAIKACKQIISTHSNEDLSNVYVSYANSLDHLKKTDEALSIYEEGIQKFPNYYQLYFNKGICYANTNKPHEAIGCFQKALLVNPNHPGSLNAIAIMEAESNRIPSILAFSRFLILEPQTPRAEKNLGSLKNLLMQGVKQEDKGITININSDVVSDSKNKKKENDFSQADLILSMAAALDFDEKNLNKTDVEKFIGKFETICASLDETKKGNSGFYWENLTPYFIEMNKKKMIKPFGYIAFAASGNEDVSKWLQENQAELEKFYTWSTEYNWKK
ncbi:tetratricopeptide repeat protein [Flavobacterium sp. DGU38]|uniref:Tetratricopeptide repeat protein n=1 Tax=Flavobacterium calami TaxID=3139144 RepID=A0ABU9IQG7_9FLAO